MHRPLFPRFGCAKRLFPINFQWHYTCECACIGMRIAKSSLLCFHANPQRDEFCCRICFWKFLAERIRAWWHKQRVRCATKLKLICFVWRAKSSRSEGSCAKVQLEIHFAAAAVGISPLSQLQIQQTHAACRLRQFIALYACVYMWPAATLHSNASHPHTWQFVRIKT